MERVLACVAIEWVRATAGCAAGLRRTVREGVLLVLLLVVHMRVLIAKARLGINPVNLVPARVQPVRKP